MPTARQTSNKISSKRSSSLSMTSKMTAPWTHTCNLLGRPTTQRMKRSKDRTRGSQLILDLSKMSQQTTWMSTSCMIKKTIQIKTIQWLMEISPMSNSSDIPSRRAKQLKNVPPKKRPLLCLSNKIRTKSMSCMKTGWFSTTQSSSLIHSIWWRQRTKNF